MFHGLLPNSDEEDSCNLLSFQIRRIGCLFSILEKAFRIHKIIERNYSTQTKNQSSDFLTKLSVRSKSENNLFFEKKKEVVFSIFIEENSKSFVV